MRVAASVKQLGRSQAPSAGAATLHPFHGETLVAQAARRPGTRPCGHPTLAAEPARTLPMRPVWTVGEGWNLPPPVICAPTAPYPYVERRRGLVAQAARSLGPARAATRPSLPNPPATLPMGPDRTHRGQCSETWWTPAPAPADLACLLVAQAARSLGPARAATRPSLQNPPAPCPCVQTGHIVDRCSDT